MGGDGGAALMNRAEENRRQREADAEFAALVAGLGAGHDGWRGPGEGSATRWSADAGVVATMVAARRDAARADWRQVCAVAELYLRWARRSPLDSPAEGSADTRLDSASGAPLGAGEDAGADAGAGARANDDADARRKRLGRAERTLRRAWVNPGAADLAEAFVVAEAAAALGVSQSAASTLLSCALALVVDVRLPATAATLAAGELDYAKAAAIVTATQAAGLGPAQARAVESLVIAQAPAEPIGSLRAALAAAVIQVAPQAATERAQAARQRRGVRLRPLEDQMSQLSAYLPAEHGASIMAHLDAAARRALQARQRAGTDDGAPIGVDAARADVLLAAVTDPAGYAALWSAPEPRWSGPTPSTDTRIVVTVSLPTVLGLADDPAVLHGYGAITAELARDLAAGGTWRCAATDPTHGSILGLGRTTYTPRYAPSGRLTDLVRARSPHCTYPGCTARAVRCDVDHRVPWPQGPTCECNLNPVCRRHHRLKTTGWTNLAPGPEPGWLTWRTRAGHTYHQPPQPALSLPPAAPPRRPPGAGRHVTAQPQPPPAEEPPPF